VCVCDATAQVDFSASKFNNEDCFVVDMGLHVYQWSGSKANHMEKQKAAQLAHSIKDEVCCYRVRAHVLTLACSVQASPTSRSSRRATTPPCRGTSSAASPRHFRPPPLSRRRCVVRVRVYARVLAVMCAVVLQHPAIVLKVGQKAPFAASKVADGPGLKKSLLTPGDVFIVDNFDQIYVWVGHSAPVAERKAALQVAADYVKSSGKPAGTAISRVVEHCEPDEFVAIFD
jgi:hypothetical protein